MTSPPNITRMLVDWSEGNPKALDDLIPLVYAELRRMAARHLRAEQAGRTLQTTGLVHEAFLRLVDQNGVRWQSRNQFFALASRLMRRILIDRARARLAAKRGAGRAAVSLDELADAAANDDDADPLADNAFGHDSRTKHAEILSIDSALTRLESLDTRQAQIVELRFFGGLTVEETARTLDISSATVKRDWTMARAWLAHELADAQTR